MTPEKIAELKKAILYNPDKGTFVRLSKHAGTAYMHPNGTGASRISVLGKEYSARTLAWALMTGEYPGRWELKSLDGNLNNIKWTNLYRTKPEHKFCSKCKVEKPFSEYQFRDAKQQIRRAECTACLKPASSIYARRGNLKKFGLTETCYEAMLQEQGGCAVCGGADTNKHLAVDHCHTTGKVRGLLCSKCNQGLGLFKDNPALLTKAAQYVS